MNKYQENKNRIIEEAKQWQYESADKDYSYGELAEYYSYFEAQAKRYGLIKEFKENGII